MSEPFANGNLAIAKFSPVGFQIVAKVKIERPLSFRPPFGESFRVAILEATSAPTAPKELYERCTIVHKNNLIIFDENTWTRIRNDVNLINSRQEEVDKFFEEFGGKTQ